MSTAPRTHVCAHRVPGDGWSGLTGTPWEPRMQTSCPTPSPRLGRRLLGDQGQVHSPVHPTLGPHQWVQKEQKVRQRRAHSAQQRFWPPGPWVGGGRWVDMGCAHEPARLHPVPRAMVQNQCRQIKALTFQLLPNLQSREERERKVAIIIFTEVGAWGGPQGQPAPCLQLNPPGPPLTNRFLTPGLPTPSSSGPTVGGSWFRPLSTCILGDRLSPPQP